MNKPIGLSLIFSDHNFECKETQTRLKSLVLESETILAQDCIKVGEFVEKLATSF